MQPQYPHFHGSLAEEKLLWLSHVATEITAGDVPENPPIFWNLAAAIAARPDIYQHGPELDAYHYQPLVQTPVDYVMHGHETHHDGQRQDDTFLAHLNDFWAVYERQRNENPGLNPESQQQEEQLLEKLREAITCLTDWIAESKYSAGLAQRQVHYPRPPAPPVPARKSKPEFVEIYEPFEPSKPFEMDDFDNLSTYIDAFKELTNLSLQGIKVGGMTLALRSLLDACKEHDDTLKRIKEAKNAGQELYGKETPHSAARRVADEILLNFERKHQEIYRSEKFEPTAGALYSQQGKQLLRALKEIRKGNW